MKRNVKYFYSLLFSYRFRLVQRPYTSILCSENKPWVGGPSDNHGDTTNGLLLANVSVNGDGEAGWLVMPVDAWARLYSRQRDYWRFLTPRRSGGVWGASQREVAELIIPYAVTSVSVLFN